MALEENQLAKAQEHLVRISQYLIKHGAPPMGDGQLPSHHPLFGVHMAKVVFDALSIPYVPCVGYFHHRGRHKVGDEAGSLIMPPEMVVAHAWLVTKHGEEELFTDLTVFGGGLRGPLCLGTVVNTERSARNEGAMYLRAQPEGTMVEGIDASVLQLYVDDTETWVADRAPPHVKTFIEEVKASLV